ncbi:MAG: GNAT family N-acetyltransferase [Candidatus Eremiobacteraeota bacterium]|nr:GNAT family N-acetyltransferase [Candidatus Eremiobacteraeota bacterium]
MSGIDVRRGTFEDRAFVAELGARRLRSSVASFRFVTDPMLEFSYERLLEVVYAQSHVLLIATADAVPAGFLLMLDQLPDEVTQMPQAFIAFMAAEPAFGGRGVGTRLLAAAEDEARKLGLPYMGLMVTEENAAARTIYERAGFLTERRLLCKPL